MRKYRLYLVSILLLVGVMSAVGCSPDADQSSVRPTPSSIAPTKQYLDGSYESTRTATVTINRLDCSLRGSVAETSIGGLVVTMVVDKVQERATYELRIDTYRFTSLNGKTTHTADVVDAVIKTISAPPTFTSCLQSTVG